MTPCPICGREPKFHQVKTGTVLSCVGDRHTFAITDDGQHQVALYKATREQLEAAWEKHIGRGEAVQQ